MHPIPIGRRSTKTAPIADRCEMGGMRQKVNWKKINPKVNERQGPCHRAQGFQFSVPWAFKLDHSQHFKPIFF